MHFKQSSKSHNVYFLTDDDNAPNLEDVLKNMKVPTITIYSRENLKERYVSISKRTTFTVTEMSHRSYFDLAQANSKFLIPPQKKIKSLELVPFLKEAMPYLKELKFSTFE